MDDGFFEGFEQVELKVDGGTAKFPIFYRSARMFTLVVPANLLKLRRLLPDCRFVPAQVAPGVGAVTLSAFEYYDTDVEPYNEFSIGIFLNSPYYAPVPCYNVLRQYFAGMYSVYIHHLPVTTEIALRAGRDFYNYPKFITDIDFDDSDGMVTCDLGEAGDRILSVSGARVGARPLGEMKFFCNLYQFRQPQLAEFKLNVLSGAIKWVPQDVSWSFNTSNPIGRELSETVLGNRALMYIYIPELQAILYGPEYIPIPLLRHAVLSPGFMPPARKPAAKKKPAARKKAAGS